VIQEEIADMATGAVAWLTRKTLLARTVTIKVRYSDFTTITRSHTTVPTRSQADVIARALQLLDKTDAGRRPVRLLGVSVHNFCGEGPGGPAGPPAVWRGRRVGPRKPRALAAAEALAKAKADTTLRRSDTVAGT
jgi:hypothetical protein